VFCFGCEDVVLERGAVVPVAVPGVFVPVAAAELGTGPRALGTFSMYCATDESFGTCGGSAAFAAPVPVNATQTNAAQ
jgi:hypothetical protein